MNSELTTGTTDATHKALSARLSVMMFLQFFIWGAWYVTIGNYMAGIGMADLTHWPYTVNPIAAIVAPFFLGLVADRYFATEKVLGTLHILGGLIMFALPGASANAGLFIGLLLAYNLCYMPTLGLSNALAFHHIDDQEKQFPLIRVFGTVGWIAAGLFIGYVLGQMSGDVLPDRTPLPLYTTAVASILLGIYSFTLPHTPPSGAGQPVSLRSMAGLDALEQLGGRSFTIFILSSLLICIPLAAYYNFAPIFAANAIYDQGVSNAMTGLLPNPSSLMSLGQMSEVLFMLLMPLCFRRLGVKWMLAIGMAAWVLRYLLFAWGAPDAVFWMIALGIALHGICYDFFFVTGQIYVDKKSTPEVRGQAQGFLVLVTYGVGMFIGAQIAGQVFNSYLDGNAALSLETWASFWYLPAIFAGGVLLFFLVAFRDDSGD
ncbi:MAG: MFS transporter [Xanthomonadales bacterium]|jgi:nucleoside transporter|nr:MFS transporter [Xanthomonadales bacterium]